MWTLPLLPFKNLDPYMSLKTLEYHHGKHHQGYITNLNNLVQGENFVNRSLEEIIQDTSSNPEQISIFNNAAQTWNHTFFWNSLTPQGGGDPKEGPLRKALEKDFGSFLEFKAAFSQAALAQFGSGWVWLVRHRQGYLEIQRTANADCPIVKGHTPLFVCDVWEHAYYLDYQNRRSDYVTIFLDHLVNWSFGEENFLKY